MANATATENWFLADQTYDHDHLDVDELSNIDGSLLMSLLEDSQVDEETLTILIQSLEPDQDSEQLESCCFHDHLDHEWLDMEMPYSYPNREIMTGYDFNGHDFEEKRQEEIMVEGLHDYSQLCYGMMMEEDDHYIGLWQ